MTTPLIYLHIPKSAGTSHRTYLEQVYGASNVRWYGIDLEAEKYRAEEVEGALALGGHVPLKFYPREMHALYSSVVRDPVMRAVSLYNYSTATPKTHSAEWTKTRLEAQQRWLDLGVDPTSLCKTIEQSSAFRYEISDVQCRYLSRYDASFEGVLQTLEEEDIVIGIFEKLSLFQEYLRSDLGFPIAQKVRANSGRAGYSSVILSEPGVINLLREINSEDQQLYDYLHFVEDGLYVGAKNIEDVKGSVPSILDRSMSKKNVDADHWASVQLFGKGVLGTDGKGHITAPLLIRNTGESHLVLSDEDEKGCAIGWVAVNDTGGPIKNARGVLRVNQTILSKETKMVVLQLTVDPEILDQDARPFIEFSIVDGDKWIRDEHPTNSSWSRIHV